MLLSNNSNRTQNLENSHCAFFACLPTLFSTWSEFIEKATRNETILLQAFILRMKMMDCKHKSRDFFTQYVYKNSDITDLKMIRTLYAIK